MWPEGPQGKDTVPFRRAGSCQAPFPLQPYPLQACPGCCRPCCPQVHLPALQWGNHGLDLTAPVACPCGHQLIPMKHSAGTGLRTGSRLHWLHVACTGLLMYFGIGRGRGDVMLEALGIAVHDCRKSCFMLPATAFAVTIS